MQMTTQKEEFLEFARAAGCEPRICEPMSEHTNFRIGGPADIFINECDPGRLSALIKKARETGMPYIIIGNGSNLLVRDEGIPSAVISVSRGTGIMMEQDGVIVCSAGVPLTKAAEFALENSLSGLEFSYGIPGTVGGAVYMNAGAYGGEIKDVLLWSGHLDTAGEYGRFTREEARLGYRTSIYQKNGFCITDAAFRLEKKDRGLIEDRMKDLISRRKAKQPLEYPSAGSTFKRPEGYYAAALIDECGLKGASVGGAMVSEKHAGFIINTGNAKCSDVLSLIEKVKREVLEQKGVSLECEVKII